DDVRSISDVYQRSQRLDSIYQSAKKPYLATISEYQSGGLRVIDVLNGTPQLIVRGPARTWRKLLREKKGLSSDPNVEVLANTPDWSAT
ncbi:MAG TPA: hypothetical protein VG387_20105, partial [Rhizomicrobium sp.]|nr:hypothetical protein [Rhizomicrobium sp.]